MNREAIAAPITPVPTHPSRGGGGASLIHRRLAAARRAAARWRRATALIAHEIFSAVAAWRAPTTSSGDPWARSASSSAFRWSCSASSGCVPRAPSEFPPPNPTPRDPTRHTHPTQHLHSGAAPRRTRHADGQGAAAAACPPSAARSLGGLSWLRCRSARSTAVRSWWWWAGWGSRRCSSGCCPGRRWTACCWQTARPG